MADKDDRSEEAKSDAARKGRTEQTRGNKAAQDRQRRENEGKGR